MLSPVVFLRETRDELAKVVFPTREKAIRLTITVIIISSIVGFFLGGIDMLLAKILETILK